MYTIHKNIVSVPKCVFIKNVSFSTSHKKNSIFTSLRLSLREFKKIIFLAHLLSSSTSLHTKNAVFRSVFMRI